LIGPIDTDFALIYHHNEGTEFQHIYGVSISPEFYMFFEVVDTVSGYMRVLDTMIIRQINGRYYLDWTN
jgi:hypothetical protein